VFDARSKRDGKSIEIVGTYNPIEADPEKKYSINEERIKYWIGVGAQPTDKVKVILKKKGII